MTVDPLLSLPAAARYLGISTASLRALVREQKIVHYRPGPKAARARFRVSDLEAYLAEVRVPVKRVPLAPYRTRRVGRLDGKPLRW